MFRYTCPNCSTVTYFRDSMGGRQTWCPSCQDEVRIQAPPQPAVAAETAAKPQTSRRAAFMTSLLALPLLGIIAWALTSVMPENAPELPRAPADAKPAAVTEANFVPPRPQFSTKKAMIARNIRHPGGGD